MRKLVLCGLLILALSLTTMGGPAATGSVQASERVQVRWFVGLGAGSDAPTIPAQEEVVRRFNESQDEIELVLEIVDADTAPDVLNTQFAADNAPDIVGPVGIKGRAQFPGAWLDLQPLVEKYEYDLSDFDPAMVEFYRTEDGLVGLPFAVFPSFLFVNLDLFDEAGVPYPPRAYGEPYIDIDGNEKEWNLDTLRELAMYLTVDANGNDPSMEEFDPQNIIQFGFGVQFADLRAAATLFGPGSLVDAEGNAQIPENWRTAMHWYQDAMWKDYFYPNSAYGQSELLNNTNWFESGNIAMVYSHLWLATCCINGLEARWDIAPVPSYNGQTIAKLHADTFSIPKGSKHPDEAFKVLTYLVGEAAGDLTKVYGGMPARSSLQASYFEELNQLPLFEGKDINWQIAIDGLKYPDKPSHEGWMPAFLEASDRYGQTWQLIQEDPNVDVDEELDKLQADLQAIFEQAK